MSLDRQRMRHVPMKRALSFAWWVLAAAILVLSLGPFMMVRFPPALDLAQQSAQIRLFGEAWGNPGVPI